MPIDHALLAMRAEQFRPRRPGGIAGLVAGAHRDPTVGEWLTIESGLLAPVPTRTARGWTLWSLVSVPERDSVAYQPPWGAVQWHWPSGRVAQLVDLGTRADLADVLVSARSAPARMWRVGSGFSRERRDEALGRLESALAAGAPDLAALAPSYADLLPAAAYPLYHALAPGSAEWLRPATEPPSPVASTADPASRPPGADGSSCRAPAAAQLPAWLRTARKLGDRIGSEEATADVEAIARGRGGPFRLAVVGTGRSLYALVDRILDVPVLPAADALPPLVLTAAPERGLVVETDGTVERLPMDPAAWERVGRAGRVRVLLDDGVLERIDGEIVVIGVDDPEAGQLLAGCDAVALATRATAGLGMAERGLIERHVTGRHVARVAVVVTQLDRIDPGERAEVIDYIAMRANGLGVPVSSGDDGEVVGAILALADPSGREADRARRLTNRLADDLASLAELARRRQAQVQTEAAARAEARRTAERELDGRLLDWRSLRNELQQRANAGVAELRSSLLSYQDDLLDRLMFDLKRSRDPRQWWEEEFPFRLRRDLEATVKRYEGQVERNVTADLEWLDGRTRELFDRTVARRSAARAAVHPEETPVRPLDAPDLTRYRLGMRVAPAVAGLLGVLFIPGGIIAMGLASAAALAAGELKLQGMVTEQRELVAAELPRALDRAVHAVSDELSDRINGIYADFLDEAERTEQAWRDTELDAIHDAARSPDSPWPQLAADARALHDELRATTEIGGNR